LGIYKQAQTVVYKQAINVKCALAIWNNNICKQNISLQLLLSVWIEFFFRNVISKRKTLVSLYSYVQNPTMAIAAPVSSTLFIWICLQDFLHVDCRNRSKKNLWFNLPFLRVEIKNSQQWLRLYFKMLYHISA